MKLKDPDDKLNQPILVRLTSKEKAALLRAAAEDNRSEAYVLRLYVTDRLIEEGFLKNE